jgi:MerR family transcriptional regulator, redox-sensitive transcriptional activator SoxR
MTGLTIGQVARQAGVATSALRYYEKVGLVPAPARASKQRRYDRTVLGRLRVIKLARDAGFTIQEVRQFLNGFPNSSVPSARWRTMASKKLAELDAMQQRIEQMKSILTASFRCECQRLQDCERWMTRPESCR